VRIAYNYNLNIYPSLTAIVTRFEVASASVHPEMLDFYQGLQPTMKPPSFIFALRQARN
jgi:hypothetical protein